MQNFEQSRTWQSSCDLAVEVYKLVTKYPPDERYALSSQLRRAVVSISTNIAEGFGRQSYKEKVQFYSIAYGSLLEVKSLLLLSVKLGLLDDKEVNVLLEKALIIQKQINASKTALKEKQS